VPTMPSNQFHLTRRRCAQCDLRRQLTDADGEAMTAFTWHLAGVGQQALVESLHRIARSQARIALQVITAGAYLSRIVEGRFVQSRRHMERRRRHERRFGMRFPRSAGRRLASSLAVLVTVAGCASLAVRPCDTIADRDGKYFGRFFLGVATLGLSEVTIQQEEIRQTYEGSPGCPPPPGVRVVSASIPSSAGGQSAALGTLVNGAPWAIVIYLNQDPDVPGTPPLTILFPTANIQVAFRPGQHRLVARPTGAAPGDLPKVTWSRQIEIDPRVRGFKLQFHQADFR
jgi:hypothetical protein